MKQEKKYIQSIHGYYKTMQQEETDYVFFHLFKIWKSKYGLDCCIVLLQTLCDMFQCDKSIIMNLVVQIQMYPEHYRHDIRHVAFLLYARDIPVNAIAWLLCMKSSFIRSWTKNQLHEQPEIKRLFTDQETSAIMKLLTALKTFKGDPF